MPPETEISTESDTESEEVKLRKRKNSAGLPKYICSIPDCGAAFKRLDGLDRHEFHHTGIKKHACMYDDCDKTYSILTHLKRHLRNTHERAPGPREKSIKCTVIGCNTTFTNACNMQRHIRDLHENPKMYTCNECQMCFRQKNMLRRHEIKEHTKVYPYNCNKCSKGFFQRWQQESHVEKCKVYICESCKQCFEKWTLYVKHCRETAHGRNSPKNKNKKPVKKPKSKTEEEPSIYKCKEAGCCSVYNYRRNLRQHVQTLHMGVRYKCSERACNHAFSSYQNLRKHLERVHPSASPYRTKQNAIKKAKAKRATRKDADKPVTSHLLRWAGLDADRELHKKIRKRDTDALDMVSKALESREPEEDATLEEIMDDLLS